MNLPATQPKFQVILDTVTEPGKHIYVINDGNRELRLPGVTTALSIIDKPQLIGWARNLACDTILTDAAAQWGNITLDGLKRIVASARKRPDRVRDEAAALGTRVHAILDRFVTGESTDPMSVPAEARPAMSAFVDWWQKQDLEFVMGDTKVGSMAHGFGGSLDALARRRSDGKIILLDWKTSNRTYDTHAVQLGGYYVGLRETFDITADEGWVVRFSKKSPVTFGAYQVADLQRSATAFLTALRLSQAMKLPHFVATKPKKSKENKA